MLASGKCIHLFIFYDILPCYLQEKTPNLNYQELCLKRDRPVPCHLSNVTDLSPVSSQLFHHHCHQNRNLAL